MKAYRRENTFRTGTYTLSRASEYKAKQHRLRTIPNPYTAEVPMIQREKLDAISLEKAWGGRESRAGMWDRKEVVYQRDEGVCGICGNFIPWGEAEVDHKTPRHRFKPPEGGDTLENLWILHREPCHQMKTKRDLHSGRRVR
jgi:hypothetical protein